MGEILAVITIAIMVIGVGFHYFIFVSQTVYNESVSHLEEIYHQANQSLTVLVNRNWTSLHMWTDYLGDVDDNEQVADYITKAKAEIGFTEFYFLNSKGEYMTTGGSKGYIDLENELTTLMVERKDTLISSVIPGKPQIILFASPVKKDVYEDFEYEAIAISFNNEDMVEALKISAFEGSSNSFVIHPNGRVIVDNVEEEHENIYNFVALLKDYSKIRNKTVDEIIDEFKAGARGAEIITIKNVDYYMVYEPAGFGDWVVVGLVPTDIVNASMNKLQAITVSLVTVIMVAVAILLIAVVISRNRQKLKEKDVEILYREELFDTLSVNVDDVFIMLNSDDYHVDYISPNIEKLVGISEKEARKDIHVIDNLVKDEKTVLILNELHEIKPGSQGEWDREYIHQKSGNMRWFHVTALCRGIRGKRKYILVLSDRTRDKQINTALEEAVNAAQSANKAKSTFLSNMSHDIRTPMNAIIGFTTLASANTGNEEKMKEYLSKILSSSNHLLSLINDVLDMSRIESGKIHLEETEANLSDILHDIKTIISGQIHAKQMELYMDVMDVADEDVFCDKTRLNQVLLNLLSNAIKFTPTGGTVSVRIAQLKNTNKDKGFYEIRVKDTGIGMSDEFQKRIFDPFERERTSTVSKI